MHVETAATAVHDAASTGPAWIAGGAALAVFAIALAIVALAGLRASRGGDDEDGDTGWGGGGGNVPSGPLGPVHPDDSLAWWPEFERQFAAWVEQTRRAERLGASSRQPGSTRPSRS